MTTGPLRRTARWAAAALLGVACRLPPAGAGERVVLEAGAGHEGELVRLGLQWHLDRWDLGEGAWRLEALLEASLGPRIAPSADP